MRHLQKRVTGLESKFRPPALHIVCCYGDQSRDDAIAEYGRDRIGDDDDLIVVIRKPMSRDGGSDAAA